MIYLDSCAIVKLISVERETAALVEWLGAHSGALVTSVLAEVEVPRALRRSAPGVLGAVAAMLARIARVEIDASIRATAAAYVDGSLRSLDAIHLATTEMLVASGKRVTAFVTYDRRLADAAGAVGLPVVEPA